MGGCSFCILNIARLIEKNKLTVVIFDLRGKEKGKSLENSVKSTLAEKVPSSALFFIKDRLSLSGGLFMSESRINTAFLNHHFVYLWLSAITSF